MSMIEIIYLFQGLVLERKIYFIWGELRFYCFREVDRDVLGRYVIIGYYLGYLMFYFYREVFQEFQMFDECFIRKKRMLNL